MAWSAGFKRLKDASVLTLASIMVLLGAARLVNNFVGLTKPSMLGLTRPASLCPGWCCGSGHRKPMSQDIGN